MPFKRYMGANARYAVMAATAVAVMLTACILAVQAFTDSMLRNDASRQARDWANNLVANVEDLPAILGGALPSDESIVFFEQAKLVGDVWRFKIYAPDGSLKVVSDQIGKTQHFSEFLQQRDPQAFAALIAGQDTVTTYQGQAGEPGFLAEAIIPIRAEGKLIGFLSVIADETERQEFFLGRAGGLAGLIGVVVLLAFGVPGLGYILRTRQKEAAENQIEHLAFHDSLTGLKNRHAITNVLNKKLLQITETGGRLAIHFVDLDRFKDVNDSMGHNVGDELLRQAASRLVLAVQGEGDIGRVGGDEFLIVQPIGRDGGDSEQLASRVVTAISHPYQVGGSILDIGASVGIALYSEHGKSAAEILKSADIALYAAKAAGRGCYRLFHPELDEAFKRRRYVEENIRRAVAEGSFALYFQPQINLSSGRLEGVEALLRLPGQDGQLIPPGEFIPIAEEIGAICDVGSWVLREGCRSLRLLPPHMKVAVNLSPIQFARGDIVGEVQEALLETGVEPCRLELEITESLLIKDSAAVRTKVEGLKSLGVSIALDDFGAGYSSLSYLYLYPFDKIKIDRSFITALATNRKVQGIIDTIVDLGQKLEMRITAEGVETQEQVHALRNLNCDQVQGFFFGKPMPVNELLIALLREAAGNPPPNGDTIAAAS